MSRDSWAESGYSDDACESLLKMVVGPVGIEPTLRGLEALVLPLHHGPVQTKKSPGWLEETESSTFGVTSRRSAAELQPHRRPFGLVPTSYPV